MRRTIIGTSWKMHKNKIEEVNDFCDTLIENQTSLEGVDVFVLPSFALLAQVQQQLSGSTIGLGAQNMAHVDYGPFTGEVSICSLLQFGCSYVELGHAERRSLFNESDEMINEKTKLALKNNIKPIVCVGETKQEKDSNIGDDVIKHQVSEACKNILKEDVTNVIIAYEPVWAIGQQVGADADYVQKQHRLIRDHIQLLYDEKVAQDTHIIYGGSVSEDNAASFMKKNDVDGLFIGRFGLEPINFIKIIQLAKSA